MNKTNVSFFCLFLISLTFFSCQEKTQEPNCEQSITSSLEVTPLFDNSEFFLDSIYQIDNDVSVKITRLKFYFHKIGNTSGDTVESALFDYSEGREMFRTEKELYTSNNLSAFIGVAEPDNTSDPSAFPLESPLNILNANDMHWGWNPGYIYVKIEGMCDTLQNGIEEFNHPLSYHVGKVVNLKTIQFDNITWNQIGNNYTMNVNLDLKTFFTLDGGFNLKVDNTCHTANGQEVLSAKIMNNFKESLTVN